MLKIYLNLSEIYNFAHDLRRLQVFFFCIKRTASIYDCLHVSLFASYYSCLKLQ